MAVHFIDRQSQVDQLLPKLMEKTAWGVDSETTGLDPYKDEVIAWQFGRPEEQYVIDNREVTIEPLRPFMESKSHKKILHNALFDYEMAAVNEGIEMEYMVCTQIAEQLMEQGKFKYKGKFTLETIAHNRLKKSLDKDTQKSFIGHKGPFSQRQIKYMAEDVEFLLPLLQDQTKDLLEAYLAKAFILECQFIPCLGDMELGGFRLNADKWKANIEENKKAREEVRKSLDKYSSQFFPVTLFGDVDINYGSSNQILKLYEAMDMKVKMWNREKKEEEEIPFGKGKGKWSKTGVKDTKSIRNLPIVKLVEKYRSYNMLINTFGQPYIDAIHPVTGRLHGRYWQLGTETGRLSSSSDVNLLNLPRDPRYRHPFEAWDDNHVIETDDYSGCELRIWAEISGDPGLCHAFQNNIDVHCYVASKLYRVEVTKKNENARLRSPAKNLNFGIAYGMGPGTLYDDLNAQGFPITREDAKKLFYTYENEFEVGVKYLRKMGELAAKQGWLANMNGRRRYWHLPDHDNREKYPDGERDWKYKAALSAIKREGGNFVIQSVNVDITKLGMIKIRDYKKKHGIRTTFCNQVYDEIVTNTHKEDSKEFHPIKQKLMIEAGEECLKKIPVEVDGEVGPCWTK